MIVFWEEIEEKIEQKKVEQELKELKEIEKDRNMSFSSLKILKKEL